LIVGLRVRIDRKTLAAIAALSTLGAAAAAQNDSGDWPQWRGPNRDGAILSFRAPAAWPDQLARRWKVDVGLGYATPILVGNRLYVFSRKEDNEILMALDAESGRQIWKTAYPAPFDLNPAAARHEKGPKSTPAFADGRLFTLGMSGIVTAFDAASGRRLWQKPAPPVAPLYHTAMSPLVDRGMVIVHVGGNNQGALTAFGPATGAVKWAWNGDGPSYGSPIVAEFGGTRQVIVLTQENVVGVNEATGALLWKRPFSTQFSQNAITPIIHGGVVIVSGLEKPVTAFKVVRRDSRWTTENVWENADAALYMANAVVVRDILFGMSHRRSGQFFALDANTGKTLWTSPPRQATNAAMSHAGDLLFILKDEGELVVANASATAFEPIKRYTIADSATWAAPTISGNRIFVKDTSSLALFTW